MKNHYQKLRVTLPQATDLDNIKVGLTDFAIYAAPKPKRFGSRRVLSLHEIDVAGCKRYANGDIWLGQVSNLIPEMMLIRECETGLTFAREVDANDVMLLPQLQKINTSDFGATTINQQDYLAAGEQIATFPATAVKARLVDKLAVAVKHNDPALALLGHLVLPAKTSVQSAYIYRYQGQNYVYAISKELAPQWFRCEPVRVKALAKNQLQLLDGLLVAPFADYTEFSAKQDVVKRSGEIDTDRFVLGQYLNFAFTQNLQKLALPEATIVDQLNQNHKLRHLVANFTQAAKKLVAPIIER